MHVMFHSLLGLCNRSLTGGDVCIVLCGWFIVWGFSKWLSTNPGAAFIRRMWSSGLAGVRQPICVWKGSGGICTVWLLGGQRLSRTESDYTWRGVRFTWAQDTIKDGCSKVDIASDIIISLIDLYEAIIKSFTTLLSFYLLSIHFNHWSF